MNIIFIGDIVGAPGCGVLKKHLGALRLQYLADVVIVNAENAASDGRGLTPSLVHDLLQKGVDMITTGNHVWAKKEIIDYFKTARPPLHLIRPLNLPGGSPGTGAQLLRLPDGRAIGVINVLGRVFMRDLVSCPFRSIETALSFFSHYTSTILVDVHAETTSEKMGIAHYFDGKVSAVVGTHTHVQTADERILTGGTAFISDVGMCGALDSMLGMKKGPVIEQMITQMPVRFSVEERGPMQLCGIFIEVDETTGLAKRVSRIRIVDDAAHDTV